MLGKLSKTKASVLILYIPTIELGYVVKDMIAEGQAVTEGFKIDVDDMSGLKEALTYVITLPLNCSRWVVMVNGDKFGVKELNARIAQVIPSALFVWVFQNYKTYKQVIGLKDVKQGIQTHIIEEKYIGSLDGETMDEIYAYYMKGKSNEERKKFSSGLMGYVKKNDRYNTDLVCLLFRNIASGRVPKAEREIIEMVGIGGNTPTAYLMGWLTTQAKTEKGINQFISKQMKLLADLGEKYDSATIYNLMKDALDGIKDMKFLQLQGKYMSWRKVKDIPEDYDKKRTGRIQRLRRYEHKILDEISLGRVQNLRDCMSRYNSYNKEDDMLKILYLYASTLKVVQEKGSGNE